MDYYFNIGTTCIKMYPTSLDDPVKKWFKFS